MSSIPTSRSRRAIPERPSRGHRPVAVVFCEGNFVEIDGKTANGLVRQSERYTISSIIDSTKTGCDAGIALDGHANGIPVVANLAEALAIASVECFIVGVAPTSGMLSQPERAVILEAIGEGLDIVNGLHEFLADDPEFAAAAVVHGVDLFDVRRPREKKDLRMFSGRVHEVTCPRIAVLGTDGAIGKRTTATVVTRALNDAGVHAVMIATGQTSLIQGARYGVALDAIPAQFVVGELEAAVLEAFDAEHPDVMIVEGQGALSHPTYLSSTAILRGSLPAGVILQHAPARTMVSDFPNVPMPTVVSEINLIETFADTKVIGITINHEHMTDAEISVAIAGYEAVLGLPATDALARPASRLLDMVFGAFPSLRHELALDSR